MHIFRFNPVSKSWVVVGGTATAPLVLTGAHFFDIGKKHGFMAATFPKEQFLMEPPAKKGHVEDSHLLYAEHAGVGEHELLLYTEKNECFAWDKEEWNDWLMLVQQRLLQVYHNPHLHFVSVIFNTETAFSIDGYQRVGDLLATSHAVVDHANSLDQELADKLLKKEEAFVVHESKAGQLYVASAPLFDKELWYIPKKYRPGFEEITEPERSSLAASLAELFPVLHKEFPSTHFSLTLHTSIAGKSDETTWWLQIAESKKETGVMPVHAFPEAFAQKLHYALQSSR